MVLNLQIADFSYTLQIVKWILFACLNTHCMKKCLCSSVYNCRPWLALFPGSTTWGGGSWAVEPGALAREDVLYTRA
jgi:hypothetical protein